MLFYIFIAIEIYIALFCVHVCDLYSSIANVFIQFCMRRCRRKRYQALQENHKDFKDWQSF